METDEDVDMAEKYRKQNKYQDGLAEKGLINARVVIPIPCVDDLREWADEERKKHKEKEKEKEKAK